MNIILPTSDLKTEFGIVSFAVFAEASIVISDVFIFVRFGTEMWEHWIIFTIFGERLTSRFDLKSFRKLLSIPTASRNSFDRNAVESVRHEASCRETEMFRFIVSCTNVEEKFLVLVKILASNFKTGYDAV